jgi:hypothetical protein
MRFLIEVVADDVDDAVTLIREAATLLKQGRIVSGRIINHCIGDYRVIVDATDGTANQGWRCEDEKCSWIDRSANTERFPGDPCPKCKKPIIAFIEQVKRKT